MHQNSRALPEIGSFLILVCGWLCFATATHRLEKIEHPRIKAEMQVALPKFMQVTLAGGDRFLATNFSVFRALTVSTDNEQPDRFAVQASIQKDAGWLNPANEDNYYIATAILSWNNQVNAAQEVLKLASESRPFDTLPPFYYAFNEYYFRHDPISGAEWLRTAAAASDSEQDRLSLQKIAARWTEKGQNRTEALRLLEGMAAQSNYLSLRKQLLLHAERVKHLIALDKAVQAYTHKLHRHPSSLSDLVTSGILEELPQDPMGQGYMLDADGKSQIMLPIKK